MAEKYIIKCDRCGRSEDAGNRLLGWFSIRFGNGHCAVRGVADLCPDCLGELHRWIGKEEGQGGRSGDD